MRKRFYSTNRRNALFAAADADANVFNLKCSAVLGVFLVICVIFNVLGVFEVDQYVMIVSSAIGLLALMIPITVYLFYDKNQLVQGRQIPRYISDSDCKLTLYRNCRNTEKIAVTSMRPLGENCKPNLFSGSVPGDSPQIYISEKEDNLKEWIDNSLRYLEGKKIKDVVILTCKTEESSFLSLYCKNGKYKSNGIDYRFTTCRKFKGLEADAIILVDVTTKTFCRPENMNFYVGASRACFFLYIACNMNDEECVQALTVMDPSCSTKRPRKALAAALNALLSSN